MESGNMRLEFGDELRCMSDERRQMELACQREGSAAWQKAGYLPQIGGEAETSGEDEPSAT
jgi:hypothetical protein